MALADSGRAIGAVTKLLREHLIRRGFAVSVGKPEVAATTDTAAKVNLFLYEATFDPSLRNISLHGDQPAPLWLSLKYLLTAFDDGESSDSPAAHELLGRGLSALQDLNFLALDAGVATDVRLALENSPEPLKITFEQTPADLISKLMQGTDEKYRFSVAFEVRPVMIAPGEPPRFSLLLGVDYTQTPPAIIGFEGVQRAVLASLGPRLSLVDPPSFEPGDVINLLGDDLHLGGLECWLASVPLSVIAQHANRMTVRVERQFSAPATEGPIAAGGVLSAGEHPLQVRQLLPGGRYRSSNLLIGRLRPVVSGGSVSGAGALTIVGNLLGTPDDDVLVAVQQDGRVLRLLEAPPPTGAPPAMTLVPAPDQKSLTVSGFAAAMGAGEYQLVVRVNGQQARVSPAVVVS